MAGIWSAFRRRRPSPRRRPASACRAHFMSTLALREGKGQLLCFLFCGSRGHRARRTRSKRIAKKKLLQIAVT